MLALCPDPKVAIWAAEPIAIGLPGSRVSPMAIGPERIPVVTDPGTALLEDYMTTTNYPFTSDFARRHFAAGEAEGKAEAILAFLTARGIEIPDETRVKIIECTDLDQLDEWIQRAATAEQVADLGGPLID